MNEALPQGDFESHITELYFRWREKNADARDMKARLTGMPVMRHETLVKMDQKIDQDQEKAQGFFDQMVRDSVEAVVGTEDRNEVMGSLKDVSGWDYGVILAAIERELVRQLEVAGVNVQDLISNQPALVREGLKEMIMDQLAGIFPCARAAIKKQEREHLVPLLAESLMETRARSAGEY